jgi:hypothetical protein
MDTRQKRVRRDQRRMAQRHVEPGLKLAPVSLDDLVSLVQGNGMSCEQIMRCRDGDCKVIAVRCRELKR